MFSSFSSCTLQFLDIKHGLVVSNLFSARHEEVRGGDGVWLCSFPAVDAIDFQATYVLFVCTATQEHMLVKCEVLHLSPPRSTSRLREAYLHINSHAK